MADYPHVTFHSASGPPRRGGRFRRLLMIVFLPILALGLGYGSWLWCFVRIEVPANKLLIVVNRLGRAIPGAIDTARIDDQVVLYPQLLDKLARQSGMSAAEAAGAFQGIRYEVRKEGRHWFSPIFYERLLVNTTQVPEGKFGVVVRKYGQPLPAGRTVAQLSYADEQAGKPGPIERGAVTGTLPPGRYAINPFAYEVLTFDKVVVSEGHVGVQTNLSGDPPREPNVYIVKSGERGVQPDLLGPGTYFDKNPFEVCVDMVDTRSQKYDMLGDDAIEFPSNDGFAIRMEATVEWALYADQASAVIVKVGDLKDVEAKIIRPYTMSLARIQGSKMTAREFIGAREHFQSRLNGDLRSKCREQGVQIRAVNVRDLEPPERMRAIIRERELTDQTMTRYENEIAEAQARAKLVEQEELATQQQELGDANREVVTMTVRARQSAGVAVTQSKQRLDVARLDLESARKDAQAILARGEAEAKVVLYEFQAQAEPLRSAVAAFGDGHTYAQNQFYQKLAPAIQSILSNTEGPFAGIFKAFDPAAPHPAAAHPAAPHPAAPDPSRDRKGAERKEPAIESEAAPDK